MSKKLRISRSPLREAIRELSAEGLIHMVPGRGSFVSIFDHDAIVQLGEVRLALEVAIARLAAERATATDIEQLQALISHIAAAMDSDKATYPLEVNFHSALGKATRNPRLAQAADEIERQLRLARATTVKSPKRAQIVYAEHKAIAEAVARRDPSAAEAIMREHIISSTAAIADLFRE